VSALHKKAPPRSDGPVVTQDELVSFFAGAVGREKALLVVSSTLREQRITQDPMSVDEALRVLDTLIAQGGIFSAVASFAKARVHLRKRGG
jgi:hypothetical protein